MKICLNNQEYNKIIKIFNDFEIELPSIIKEDEEDISVEIGDQCITIPLSNIDNLSNEIKTYFLKFGDSLVDIKDWYKKINQYVYTELDEMEGTIFLMLLAIMSSRTSVESNTIIAMKVLGDLLDDIKYRKPQLKRFIEEYGGGMDLKELTSYFSSLKFYSYIVNDKLSYGKSTLMNLIKVVRFVVNNNFNVSKTDAINFLLKNYNLDSKKFDANSIKSYKIHKYTINLIDPDFEIIGQEKSHLFSVIDRHMIRYFLPISRDKDLDEFSGMVFSNRKGLYYILIDFLKKIQNKLDSEGINLKPNELQAIIWYIAIEKYGKDKTDYKSYIDVINRLNEILMEISDQQENEELTIKKMISLIKGREKLIMKKKNFPSKEEKKQMKIKFGESKKLDENKPSIEDLSKFYKDFMSGNTQIQKQIKNYKIDTNEVRKMVEEIVYTPELLNELKIRKINIPDISKLKFSIEKTKYHRIFQYNLTDSTLEPDNEKFNVSITIEVPFDESFEDDNTLIVASIYIKNRGKLKGLFGYSNRKAQKDNEFNSLMIGGVLQNAYKDLISKMGIKINEALNLKSRADIQKKEAVEFYINKLKEDRTNRIPNEIWQLIPLNVKQEIANDIYELVVNYYDKTGELMFNKEYLKFLDFLDDDDKSYIIEIILETDKDLPVIEWILEKKDLLLEEYLVTFINRYYKEIYYLDYENILIENFNELEDSAKKFLITNLIQHDSNTYFELILNNINLLNGRDAKYDFLSVLIDTEHYFDDERLINIINGLYDFYKNYNVKISIPLIDKIVRWELVEDLQFFYQHLSPHLQKYFLQKRLEIMGYDQLEDFEKSKLDKTSNLSKYKNLQQKVNTTGEFLSDEEFKELTPKQKQKYIQRLKRDGEDLTDWEKRYLGENKLNLKSRTKEIQDDALQFYINKINKDELINLPPNIFDKLSNDLKIKYLINKKENNISIKSNEYEFLPDNLKNELLKKQYSTNNDYDDYDFILKYIPNGYKGYSINYDRMEGTVFWFSGNTGFDAAPFWKSPTLKKLSQFGIPKEYHNLNTVKEIYDFINNFYLPKTYETIEKIIKNDMNEGIKLKNGVLNESRTIISEEMTYHIENNLSLNQNVFRIGSESYYNLISECRDLFNKGVIELNEKDRELVESNLGERVKTTHGWVYLDSPFTLNEIDETLETWGRMCEAEYKGKDVTLNKPFRSSSGGKKYAVYVKNPENGNVKLIRFGDSNMRVRTANKERVKSFVARHKCHEKKDKTKAGYWACRLPQYGLVKYSGRFW
jgi:hypothetical protein